MPRTRRARTLAVPIGEVWRVVGDPHELSRWWPRVERVERVSAGRFTEVLRTERGRTVRADFHIVERDGPERIGWAQELEGTPFAKVLAAASVHVALAAGDRGTRVTVVLDQRLRGMSRLGGLLVRRASRRLLTEALDGLETTLAPG